MRPRDIALFFLDDDAGWSAVVAAGDGMGRGVRDAFAVATFALASVSEEDASTSDEGETSVDETRALAVSRLVVAGDGSEKLGGGGNIVYHMKTK